MSGLLRRIRRPGAAAETRTEATPLPEPAHGSAPETAPVRADGSPLPAGVTPEDLALRSGAGRRGRVRRRARFLRRARELALRDLGGLVYEAHRRDQDGAKLIAEKVQHLGVIDAELRALEVELGTPRGETVLREPGVGGTCPRCGELHASDARYCSRCGLDLTTVPVEEPTPEQAESVPPEPAASEPAGSGEAAPSESTPAQTEAGEAAPPEQPRRDSKRWWRRRSAAASEATGAELAASEATAAEPAASEASSAEPATTEAPAAEQPTKDLASESPQAGNGRAATKDQTPDPESRGMTEVAEKPPETERACPKCGASLAPDQEWCLNCGTAVGTRIAPTPRWRLPVFLVGTLLALIAAALVLAFVELSGDPQPVAQAPSVTATATPAGPPADDGGSAAPPVAGETPTPAPTVVPSVTPTPQASATPDANGRTPEPIPGGNIEPSTSGDLATWPADKTGWTAVLASTTSRSEAEKKARAAGGGEVGVLDSDDFSSLRKGYWVVFSGQYDSRSAAETAAEDAGNGAYAREIVPR